MITEVLLSTKDKIDGLNQTPSRLIYVSEFLQLFGLRLVEPMPHRAYASERITVLFADIVLVCRVE
jgi:hypothetical protein